MKNRLHSLQSWLQYGMLILSKIQGDDQDQGYTYMEFGRPAKLWRKYMMS